GCADPLLHRRGGAGGRPRARRALGGRAPHPERGGSRDPRAPGAPRARAGGELAGGRAPEPRASRASLPALFRPQRVLRALALPPAPRPRGGPGLELDPPVQLPAAAPDEL